jgi:hypothetical protein
MDRNDGGPAVDLEALRAALDAINDGKGTCEFEGDMVTAERLDDAHYTVELALDELTTRRARDAEVEALVAACRLARSYMSEAIEYETPCAKRDGATVDAALAPFTGAIHDHAGKMT